VYTIHQSFVKEKHRHARWVWPTVVLKVDSKAPYYGTFLQKFFRKTTAFCTVFSLALAFCSQPSQSSSSSPENNSKTFKQSTCSCIHPVLTMQVFIIIQKYCYGIIESITFLTYSFYSFDIPILHSNMCHPIVIFFSGHMQQTIFQEFSSWLFYIYQAERSNSFFDSFLLCCIFYP